MKIAIIDGQGGGVGKAVAAALAASGTAGLEVLALGTNSAATSAMIKAGAAHGATGENAITVNAARVDLIVGPIGIIAADSMLGELTPAMARAVAASPARKVLIPIDRCGLTVAGLAEKPLQERIADAVQIILGAVR